eukprot:tig00021098_g18209.t1
MREDDDQERGELPAAAGDEFESGVDLHAYGQLPSGSAKQSTASSMIVSSRPEAPVATQLQAPRARALSAHPEALGLAELEGRPGGGAGAMASAVAGVGLAAAVERLVPYIAADVLSLGAVTAQLGPLRAGGNAAVASVPGAALFVDVSGFSSLARSLTRSSSGLGAAAGAVSCEKLVSTLNEYFSLLVSALHGRGLEVLFFAGDAIVAFVPATEGRTLQQAASSALAAALEVRGIAFEKQGIRLQAHTGLGAGDLLVYFLRGTGQRAWSQVLYVGDLMTQESLAIRAVCEAQRESSGDDIVLSEPALVLLEGCCTVEQAEGLEPGGRAYFRLTSAPAAEAEAESDPPSASGGASARNSRPSSLRSLKGPPSMPRALSTKSLAAALMNRTQSSRSLAPAAAAPPAECPCATRRPAAAAALASFSDAILPLLPASGSKSGTGGYDYFHNDIRTVFIVFASFPELDTVNRSMQEGDQWHAARFAQVTRAVYRIAEGLDGDVNKVFLDDKGASALLSFGNPGRSHEDDAERAVRAAMSLADWFGASGSPFAAGVAGGPTFCGTLGSPCRKEYALIGDSVILAARLMAAARANIGSGSGRVPLLCDVLCDSFVSSTISARRRRLGFRLDALPPIRAKGFSEPVFVSRPKAVEDVPRDFEESQRRMTRRLPMPGSGSFASDGAGAGADAGGRNSHRSESSISESASRRSRVLDRHPVPIFGRDAVLERCIEEVRACAAGGQGGTIFIEGDAGFGKTRILREVVASIGAERFVLLQGATAATEESTPLYAFRGVLASLLEAQGALAPSGGLANPRESWLPAAGAGQTSWVAELEIPVLWSAILGGGSGSGRSGRGGRGVDRKHSYQSGYQPLNAQLLVRVANSLARLIHALETAGRGENRRGRQVALVVEDAHWMDSSSWNTLRSLREACPRLLIVISTRPIPRPPDEYLILLQGQTPEERWRAYGSDLAPRASDIYREPATPKTPQSRLRGLGFLGHNAFGSIRRPWQAAADSDSETPVMDFDREDSRDRAPADNDDAGRRGERRARAEGAPGPVPGISNASPTARRPVVVHLGPLARDDARMLLLNLSERMKISWPADFVESVLEKASGVPLFLVELCRQQMAAADTEASKLAIPDSLQQLVLQHADGLPPQAQAVLKLAAIVGNEFTATIIRAVDPSGMSANAIHFAIRLLWRDNLITVVDSATGHPQLVDEEDAEAEAGEPPGWPPEEMRLDFHHQLVKETIYSATANSLRREVHRRYAEHLEKLDGADIEAASALVHHWRCAEDLPRALVHLSNAAWQAVRTNALKEASAMLADVCATIDDHGIAGPETRPLPAALRLACSGAATGRRASVVSADGFGIDAQDRARWRTTRDVACGALASIAYYNGNMELSHELAVAVLVSLGEAVPARKASLLGVARLLVRLARLGRRAAKDAAADGRGLPAYAAHRDCREVALDCLLLVMWINMRNGKQGAPKQVEGQAPPQARGFELAAFAIARCVEISCATPKHLRTIQDVRILSTFSTFLDIVGMTKTARGVLQRARERAIAIGDDTSRAFVASHTAMQACRHGRFREGCAEFEIAVSLEGTNPRIKLDAGVIYALTFVLQGQYAAARRTCGELIRVSKHLGIDGRVIQVVALVDASTALLEGRPARAEHVLRFVEPLNDFIQQQEWWYLRSLDVFRGICAWRAGDAASAAASFEGAFEYWRGEVKTVTWPALLFISVLLDFALWWQSDTAAALAAALDANRPKIRLGAVARLRALACGGSPRASVSDYELELEAGRARAQMPATPAPLTARSVLLDTGGAGASKSARERRVSAVRIVSDLDAAEAEAEAGAERDRGQASDIDRGVDALALLVRPGGGGRLARTPRAAASAPASASASRRGSLSWRGPASSSPSRPPPAPPAYRRPRRRPPLPPPPAARAGGRAGDETVRALAAEARQAAAFLRELAPGRARARRLASLRAARDGFAAGGLRPFEALACMQLARAEPDRAAAAAAVDAAGRIADETRTLIPALQRLRGARSGAGAGTGAEAAPEGYLSLFG